MAACAIGARQQATRFLITDDLLAGGIEVERSADANGDVRQMDQRDAAMAF